jgi:large subunit ribosomal protein L24
VGSVKLNVSRADFAPLRGGASLPASFQAALGFSPSQLSFEQLTGNVAGSNIRGKIALGRGEKRTVSGEIETDTLEAGALLAHAIGVPPGVTLWKWPAEPFSDGLPGDLTGSLGLRAMRATLTPTLTARDLRTTLRVDRDELALEDFSAAIAGGRLTGRLIFKESAQGLSTQGQLALANADVTTFLPDATRPPITGRLGVEVYVEGSGRSPQALLGSLQGAGSMTLGNAEFAALDPRAFATVTRAVDQGQPIEAPRIQSFTTSALTSGRLAVRELKGDLTISAGQIRLANVRAKGEGADVTIGGALDLTNGTIDSRIVLTGAEQVSGARPDIFLSLRGPLASAERNIDVSALTSWLTLRAVERQAKQLEAIERQPAPVAAPPIVVPPSQPSPPPARSEAPPAAAPRSEAQAPPAARGEVPAPRPPRPAAPALPPPVDITPGGITRLPPPPAGLR